MKNWYQRFVVPRLLNKEMGSAELEKIRREVLEEASGIVLEIGVGPGYNIPLYKDISKFYALEPSQELIDIARKRSNGVKFHIDFLNMGAEQIPLSDHSVDTVVSTWTLCSVKNPKKVLREIKRILRPQGKFIFVDHGASPQKIAHALQRIITPLTRHFTGNCHYDRNIEKLIREED